MAENSFQKEWDSPEISTIAELAANLVYRLPGCDDVMIRFTLREAYGEFCRLSNALVTVREIPLEAGETLYPLSNMIPDGRVECVRKVSTAYGQMLCEGLDYRISTGVPPALSIMERFLPKDGAEETSIAVECLEMPNSGSERVPKWFIRKYGDAISAGALVRLFSMTGKAWSDPAQARIELVRWEGYVAAARLGGMSGSQFGNGRFNPVDTSEML